MPVQACCLRALCQLVRQSAWKASTCGQFNVVLVVQARTLVQRVGASAVPSVRAAAVEEVESPEAAARLHFQRGSPHKVPAASLSVTCGLHGTVQHGARGSLSHTRHRGLLGPPRVFVWHKSAPLVSQCRLGDTREPLKV